MTLKEENAVEKLGMVAREIRDGVFGFKNEAERRINDLAAQVEKKHAPIYLEKDILSTAQEAINNSIKSVLSGYNSPLQKLVTSVVEQHSDELRAIINSAFETVIKTEDFRASVVSAFAHKISRSLTSGNNGLVDKVSNDLKKDAAFMARLTLAVSNVVEDFLKEQKAGAN